MAIYTKVGDKGKTSLLNAEKLVSKNLSVIRAIGAIDEANSYLGIVLAESRNIRLNKVLLRVQDNFFTINSILAGAKLKLNQLEVKELERIIDQIDGELPPLKNFILPGGNKVAARLMFARTLVRRAEREVVSINQKLKVKNQKEILKYLNRLSDTLFMLAREENYNHGVKEKVWNKK